MLGLFRWRPGVKHLPAGQAQLLLLPARWIPPPCHHEDPRLPLKNLLMDGELVLGINPQTKTQGGLSLPFKTVLNPHHSF